jgi:tetratricopeptide (TPR) repeat protein
MSFRRLIPLAAVALLTIGLVSAIADEVVLVTGSTVKQAVGGRVRGTIQTESPSELVVRLGANSINVPIDQVVSVRYDGQPASMALAEANESGGQLAKAAELYRKAAGEATAKPLIEQTARYKAAEVTADLAMADPSKAAEAITMLEAFVRTYPESRHTAAALDTLARLQLQKGDFSSVDRTIGALSKLPAGADRAAVLRAKTLARKGDHAAAIAELDGLIKGAPAGSVRQREARLAKAESLAGLKKFTEAETDVRDVIKTLPAEDVPAQSTAYNTLGDCLRAAGRPKDALIAYLHTDVLYAKDKEQHPRALARIAQLWRELKRDDRADEVMQRLRQDYPQSPWLNPSTMNP